MEEGKEGASTFPLDWNNLTSEIVDIETVFSTTDSTQFTSALSARGSSSPRTDCGSNKHDEFSTANLNDGSENSTPDEPDPPGEVNTVFAAVASVVEGGIGSTAFEPSFSPFHGNGNGGLGLTEGIFGQVNIAESAEPPCHSSVIPAEGDIFDKKISEENGIKEDVEILDGYN
eukprot:Filipodium_phascolosomae@DN7979_c0_g1_i1.p1